MGNTVAGNLAGVDLGSAAWSFVQDNVIANNNGGGVIVSSATNRLRRNSIYDARAARKLGQYAAQKVGHLQGVHYTCF